MLIRALPLWILLAALSVDASAAAGKPLTRGQAVQALAQAAPSARRSGVERLGEVGTMADADRLVDRLADDDPQVRELAAQALWKVWSRSNDRAIDALFKQGVAHLAASRFAEADATFSQIVQRKPSFAEGWNKRATVRFLRGEYEASLKDCDEVIKRNPKHFGALSGYAQIYLQLGDLEHALEYLERAFEVNPNLDGAAVTIQILRQQVEERRRKST